MGYGLPVYRLQRRHRIFYQYINLAPAKFIQSHGISLPASNGANADITKPCLFIRMSQTKYYSCAHRNLIDDLHHLCPYLA